MVYPTAVGAFAVSIVPVDPNCRPSGEIFVDACLAARSGDTHTMIGCIGLDKEPLVEVGLS